MHNQEINNNMHNQEVNNEGNSDKKHNKKKHIALKIIAIILGIIIVLILFIHFGLPNIERQIINDFEVLLYEKTGLDKDLNKDGSSGKGRGFYKKPVIYLYPEEETQISVNIETTGRLTCTYPKYDNGWTVTAYPDGLLIDSQGKKYNYLYWEGEASSNNITKGYCIAGSDSAEFLENKLQELGLNRKEANEFIVYWLPLLENNVYNIISFNNENYCNNFKLNIDPKPDNLIRVFMTFKPVDTFIEIEPEEVETIDRQGLRGFTVVEWGGTQLEN